MKKIIALCLLFVFLFACKYTEDEINTERIKKENEIKQIQNEFKTTFDNAKQIKELELIKLVEINNAIVYRFYDKGEYRYVAIQDKRITVDASYEYTMRTGKTTTTHYKSNKIETLNQ